MFIIKKKKNEISSKVTFETEAAYWVEEIRNSNETIFMHEKKKKRITILT